MQVTPYSLDEIRYFQAAQAAFVHVAKSFSSTARPPAVCLIDILIVTGAYAGTNGLRSLNPRWCQYG